MQLLQHRFSPCTNSENKTHHYSLSLEFRFHEIAYYIENLIGCIVKSARWEKKGRVDLWEKWGVSRRKIAWWIILKTPLMRPACARAHGKALSQGKTFAQPELDITTKSAASARHDRNRNRESTRRGTCLSVVFFLAEKLYSSPHTSFCREPS